MNMHLMSLERVSAGSMRLTVDRIDQTEVDRIDLECRARFVSVKVNPADQMSSPNVRSQNTIEIYGNYTRVREILLAAGFSGPMIAGAIHVSAGFATGNYR